MTASVHSCTDNFGAGAPWHIRQEQARAVLAGAFGEDEAQDQRREQAQALRITSPDASQSITVASSP